MAVVVSDTSPIRALAHLGLLDVLTALYGEVWVPPAVVAEAASAGVSVAPPRFQVRAVANAQLVRRLRTSLDLGEAEAIALAIEVDADLLLIDEARGRDVARSLGLDVRGVLGVLIQAKAAGHVPAVAPLVQELTSGLKFFLSDRVIAAALSLAGESTSNT